MAYIKTGAQQLLHGLKATLITDYGAGCGPFKGIK
jgi:hypothetical protein